MNQNQIYVQIAVYFLLPFKGRYVNEIMVMTAFPDKTAPSLNINI